MSTAEAAKQKRPAGGHTPPVVAIVGRPNVGKSALFNRMLGRRQALVEDIPGTTRDRLYGDVSWRGERFRIVDTGGLDPEAEGGYPELIRRQVELAVAEASVLLFVVALYIVRLFPNEILSLVRTINDLNSPLVFFTVGG